MNNISLIFLILNIGCIGYQGSKDKLNEQQILEIGKKYSEWFYVSKLDSLSNRILDRNYKLSDLKNFRKKVQTELGNELDILNEQYGSEPWQYYYVRYSRFENSPQPVRTLFTFDDNKIYQFSVESLPLEAPTRFLDYKVKTKLFFPFKDEWFVAWGGRNINENQHTISKEQRFAYDLLIRKNGKTFTGTGNSNQDYYCYNKAVISPGSGIIIEIVNSVDDNKPGQMSKIHGNRVVIDHRNGEYSILAHFKKGSIVVKVQDSVVAGQLLGFTGNSGHSSEPHIHYHLQNSPDIDNGEGLPIKFESYFSNGEYIEFGEPIIGERVSVGIQP